MTNLARPSVERGASGARVTDMEKLDFTEIGGGYVSVYFQDCSSAGNEVYLEVKDLERNVVATTVMDPKDARSLAKELMKVVDDCERANKEDKVV